MTMRGVGIAGSYHAFEGTLPEQGKREQAGPPLERASREAAANWREAVTPP